MNPKRPYVTIVTYVPPLRKTTRLTVFIALFAQKPVNAMPVKSNYFCTNSVLLLIMQIRSSCMDVRLNLPFMKHAIPTKRVAL